MERRKQRNQEKNKNVNVAILSTQRAKLQDIDFSVLGKEIGAESADKSEGSQRVANANKNRKRIIGEDERSTNPNIKEKLNSKPEKKEGNITQIHEESSESENGTEGSNRMTEEDKSRKDIPKENQESTNKKNLKKFKSKFEKKNQFQDGSSESEKESEDQEKNYRADKNRKQIKEKIALIRKLMNN